MKSDIRVGEVGYPTPASRIPDSTARNAESLSTPRVSWQCERSMNIAINYRFVHLLAWFMLLTHVYLSHSFRIPFAFVRAKCECMRNECETNAKAKCRYSAISQQTISFSPAYRFIRRPDSPSCPISLRPHHKGLVRRAKLG